MKKISILLMTVCSLLFAIPVHAMEMSETESVYGVAYDESLAELHTGYYITGIEYGEIVDGCFVRTYDEEVRIINRVSLDNPGLVDVGYEMALAENMRLTKNTDFTPEMEAAGYKLSDDGTRILDPDADEGESSGGIYSSMTSGKTGMDVVGDKGTLTIMGTVSAAIREKEYPIQVVLGNDKNEAFVIMLSPHNNYMYIDTFPAGTYSVMEAGVPGDNTSQYPLTYVDGNGCTLKNGGAEVIELGIAVINAEMTQALEESLENSDYTFADYKVEAAQRAAEQAILDEQAKAEQEKRDTFKAFLPFIISLGIVVFIGGCGAIVVAIIKKKNNVIN